MRGDVLVVTWLSFEDYAEYSFFYLALVYLYFTYDPISYAFSTFEYRYCVDEDVGAAGHTCVYSGVRCL